MFIVFGVVVLLFFVRGFLVQVLLFLKKLDSVLGYIDDSTLFTLFARFFFHFPSTLSVAIPFSYCSRFSAAAVHQLERFFFILLFLHFKTIIANNMHFS